MLFSDYSFIYILLPVTLIVYYIVPRKMKNPVLFVASVCFYGWTGIGNLILAMAFIWINYNMAIRIARRGIQHPSARRTLHHAILADILIYGSLLYFGPCTQLLNQLSGGRIHQVTFLAPLGMGFLLMNMISYLIDVANGTVRARKSILQILLYGLLFVRVPAGPLVSYHKMNQQIQSREETLSKLGRGIVLFVVGLAKMTILSKSFYRLFLDLKQADAVGILGMWLSCFAFGFAVYFGFGGMSDMARGLGKAFGFELPENFRYPFCQQSISGFWKNWHISFKNWIQEYILHPLGVEQLNGAGKACLVLLLWSMFGLWHGAGVRFLVWGIYFAVLMGFEKMFVGKMLTKLPVFVKRIGLCFLVSAGWTWFFSSDIKEAVTNFLCLFGVGNSGGFQVAALYYVISHWGLWIAGIIGATPIVHRVVTRLFYDEEEPKTMYCIILYLGLFLVSVAFMIG